MNKDTSQWEKAQEGLEPEPLRKSLVDFAEQILDFYKNK